MEKSLTAHMTERNYRISEDMATNVWHMLLDLRRYCWLKNLDFEDIANEVDAFLSRDK